MSTFGIFLWPKGNRYPVYKAHTAVEPGRCWFVGGDDGKAKVGAYFSPYSAKKYVYRAENNLKNGDNRKKDRKY